MTHTPITLPPDYRPSLSEPYMNPKQLEYFRFKLLAWHEELMQETEDTLSSLKEEEHAEPDMADRATTEINRTFELRRGDRKRKLLSKIEEALARVEEGTYGYCEETGEPIGLGRLEARPVATLCISAQERHERKERVSRDA